MPFEPPSQGNPYEFALKQHIHMAHCIGKFCNAQKKVEVWDKNYNKKLPDKKKDARFFCAKRAWDERAEKGYMHEIEDAFRKTINGSDAFSERNHVAITNYFILWQLRHHYGNNDIGDVRIPGMPGSALAKNQEEILESKGISYIRNNGLMPSRFMTSISMQLDLYELCDKHNDLKWGLVKAISGEFICPDCCKMLAIIPISPLQAFIAGRQDYDISFDQVKSINKQLVEISTNYYFARELSKCPR